MEVIIDAARRPSLGARLAEYRGQSTLLKYLVARNWKVRYYNTAMSVVWALAQPMLPALLLGFIFSRALAGGDDDVPYVLFLTAGLVPWSFLTLSVTSGSGSFIGHSTLLTKVYFPRALLPAAAVLALVLELAGSCVALLVWMLVSGFPPRVEWLALPVLCVVTALMAFLVSLGLGALNLIYRDVRHATPFLMQVWMYATPVLYPLSLVPERWHWAVALNPMTGVILGFRSALFGHPVDWSLTALSLASAIVLATASVMTYSRLEDELAVRA